MTAFHHISDEKAPIVVVGAGLAGLYTALKLSPLPVTVISPASLGKQASSAWAQGGIAAAVGEGDSPEQHAIDTIETGKGIVDKDMAYLIANDAPERILDLLSYGVPFDKDLEGKLKLSREAAHTHRRIVRVKGDGAGRAVMEALVAAVRKTPSITLMEGYRVDDLATQDGRVTGVYVWPTDADTSEDMHGRLLSARGVVIAAGGSGGLYKITTNPVGNRGDAIAMAARAGAVISDAEFVQFHPTAINVGADPAPLATEALRGEGAILVNGEGKRFMENIHEGLELAPRDIVARAVHQENMSGRGAFLDTRDAVGPRIHDDFPAVTAACLEHGVDPALDLIPVATAAHYHMGGIWTDADGRSTVDGLWVCGEAASTGVHGANRLASNSLLEAMVFAGRIAEDILGLDLRAPRRRALTSPAHHPARAIATDKTIVAQIRADMSDHLGVIRNGTGMLNVLRRFTAMSKGQNVSLPLLNMLTTARLITFSAILREESRGGHYRSDFPETREAFADRSYITLADLEACFGSRPHFSQDELGMKEAAL